MDSFRMLILFLMICILLGLGVIIVFFVRDLSMDNYYHEAFESVYSSALHNHEDIHEIINLLSNAQICD